MKRKIMVIAVLICVFLTLDGAALYLFASNWTEENIVTDPMVYTQYFGERGIHRDPTAKNHKTGESFLVASDIFPKQIPESAQVDMFYYQYLNKWDPCYLICLVYRLDQKEYDIELTRLKNISSSEKGLVYGAEGFSYELAAVNASEKGYIYALADQENKRLIYVEITFCNYFTDIDYLSVIPEEYLPIGFDAMRGNSARKNWEQGNSLEISKNTLISPIFLQENVVNYLQKEKNRILPKGGFIDG